MNISFMEISLSMSIFHTTLNLSVGSFFGVLSPQEIGSSLLQVRQMVRHSNSSSMSKGIFWLSSFFVYKITDVKLLHISILNY